MFGIKTGVKGYVEFIYEEICWKYSVKRFGVEIFEILKPSKLKKSKKNLIVAYVHIFDPFDRHGRFNGVTDWDEMISQ